MIVNVPERIFVYNPVKWKQLTFCFKNNAAVQAICRSSDGSLPAQVVSVTRTFTVNLCTVVRRWFRFCQYPLAESTGCELCSSQALPVNISFSFNWPWGFRIATSSLWRNCYEVKYSAHRNMRFLWARDLSFVRVPCSAWTLEHIVRPVLSTLGITHSMSFIVSHAFFWIPAHF